VDDDAYREWIDSFWAKDIQELFEVRRRAAFLKFMELVFRQSGGLFEATAFAAPCEVSRQTIVNYLEILETTLMVVTLRPFSGASAAEIKAQRKVYAFDTGFVCYSSRSNRAPGVQAKIPARREHRGLPRSRRADRCKRPRSRRASRAVRRTGQGLSQARRGKKMTPDRRVHRVRV